MRRMFSRVVKGSHMTSSVPRNLTPGEYHACVTMALEHYAESDSRIY